jgi:hypothetical protein
LKELNKAKTKLDKSKKGKNCVNKFQLNQEFNNCEETILSIFDEKKNEADFLKYSEKFDKLVKENKNLNTKFEQLNNTLSSLKVYFF